MGICRARVAAVVLAACAALAACTSSGGSDAASSRVTRFTAGPGTTAGPSTPDSSSSVPTTTPASDAGSGANTLPPGSSAPPVRPAPAKPLTTLTVQGQYATYKIKVWAQDRTTSCYDHAYGTKVVRFLTTHPCRGIYRRIATTTIKGRTVGFNQAQLSFSGADPVAYRTASEFQSLVSRDGTGNITDLLRDGYRLPGGPSEIPTPHAFRAQSQDSAVTITDAWYLDGSTPQNDPALTSMAEDLFLQF